MLGTHILYSAYPAGYAPYSCVAINAKKNRIFNKYFILKGIEL
jgi:hypothetical protein